MQEHRVTVMGETHPLPDPFFVLATQNPIELEGTYPLPEAQLDRFLFKVEVHSNDVDVLKQIVLHREIGVPPTIESVITREAFLDAMAMSRRIYLPDVVAHYIARLVDATHSGRSTAAQGVKYGASPRAALGMAAASKARALLAGRINASFEDVRDVAVPVLQHRIVLDYQARLDGRTGADTVQQLLEEISPHDRDLPQTLAPGARETAP
jgi:MoxR-like ATPase